MITCRMLAALLGGAALFSLGCVAETGDAPEEATGEAEDAIIPPRLNTRIRNPASNLCMATGPAFGTVIATDCDPTDTTQRFDVTSFDPATPNINVVRPVVLGFQCLDTAFAAPGEFVRFNPCVASPTDPRTLAQLWTFVPANPVGAAPVSFRNSATGPTLCLQAPASAGGQVRIANCAAIASQQWSFVP